MSGNTPQDYLFLAHNNVICLDMDIPMAPYLAGAYDVRRRRFIDTHQPITWNSAQGETLRKAIGSFVTYFQNNNSDPIPDRQGPAPSGNDIRSRSRTPGLTKDPNEQRNTRWRVREETPAQASTDTALKRPPLVRESTKRGNKMTRPEERERSRTSPKRAPEGRGRSPSVFEVRTGQVAAREGRDGRQGRIRPRPTFAKYSEEQEYHADSPAGNIARSNSPRSGAARAARGRKSFLSPESSLEPPPRRPAQFFLGREKTSPNSEKVILTPNTARAVLTPASKDEAEKAPRDTREPLPRRARGPPVHLCDESSPSVPIRTISMS